jgi:hypothetical protein
VTSMSSDRDPARDRKRPVDATTAPGADEPEPDWAEEIRARRRARGDRLREIFATFDDEPVRREPPSRDGAASQDRGERHT